MSRIVLVEDDAALCYALQSALERAGHRVVAFNNATTAWSAVGGDEALDLLISDVIFPIGQTNGLALLRTAKQHHPGVAVIVITGHEEAAAHARDEQDISVLMKPFELADLVTAAAAAIGQAKAMKHDFQA